MHIDVRLIDMSQQIGNYPVGENPVVVIQKEVPENQTPKPGAGVENGVPGVYHILQDQLPKNSDEIRWTFDKGKGTHISVPMIRYDFTGTNPEQYILFGSQFAAYACWLAEDKKPFERLIILIGNVYSRFDQQENDPPGSTTFVGLVIKQKETT